MPLSYRFFACETMPQLAVGESVASRVQLGLPWGDDEAESRIEYLGKSSHPTFERYDCTHQQDREVDAILNHNPIRRLIFNDRFTTYYNRDKGYFLAQTGKREAREFFSRLANAAPQIIAQPGAIDGSTPPTVVSGF